METWDEKLGDFIETPEEMKNFILDVEKLCQKYNLSISHEDTHGSFIIENYTDENIKWLFSAIKKY